MQAKRTFEFYEKVPPGSTLEVTVKVDEGGAQNDALVVSSAGPSDDETWTNTEILHPQVGRKTLHAGHGYAVRVSTFFQATVQGRVEIGIRKPNGTHHSTPYHWPLEGNQGGDHLCGVFIKMGGGA